MSISSFLVGIVALQHFAFLVLEMFLWTKPIGLRVFRQSLASAQASAVLAQNQGLYNGFLAAGLVWSLAHGDVAASRELKSFFLGCVAVAGAYGAFTVNRRIFFVQAVPALLALALVLLGR